MGEMIDGQPLFPGDDSFDQIYKIISILGNLNDNFRKKFGENSNFKNMKMPEIRNPETLSRRYKKKADPLALDLLTKMLCLDEKERITATQALQHPYFKDMIKEENSEIVPIQKEVEKQPKIVERIIENDKKENLQKNTNPKQGYEVEYKGKHSKQYAIQKTVNKVGLKPKHDSSFAEDNKSSTNEAKYYHKNKSENINLKTKIRNAKYPTANSVNFVIKKVRNFGASFYNSNQAKISSRKEKKKVIEGKEMLKSSFFKFYDAPYQNTNASRRMLPSISNIKSVENRSSWNY